MLMEVAVQAAREAGALIRSRYEAEIRTEEKTSSFDIVTDVDQASEKLIKQLIMDTFPNHSFLGEEESFTQQATLSAALQQAADEPYLWIVDPIDGTSNFVHGLPGFSVSIALARRGELELGVVYDPLRDIMYGAEKGKGAYADGKPIRVSDSDNLAKSILSTGFASELPARERLLESMQTVGMKCRTIRSFGSAALHLALVASGKLGGHWQFGLSVWDIAAGILLVQEAGGLVTNMSGDPYRLTDRDILATNGKHHPELLSMLKPLARV